MRRGIIVSIIIVLITTVSCRTGTVSHAGSGRTEIRTVRDTVRDSVGMSIERVVRDSVIVERRGDTVYIDRRHVRAEGM